MNVYVLRAKRVDGKWHTSVYRQESDATKAAKKVQDLHFATAKQQEGRDVYSNYNGFGIVVKGDLEERHKKETSTENAQKRYYVTTCNKAGEVFFRTCVACVFERYLN